VSSFWGAVHLVNRVWGGRERNTLGTVDGRGGRGEERIEVSKAGRREPAFLRYTVSAKKKDTRKAGSDAVYHNVDISGHHARASIRAIAFGVSLGILCAKRHAARGVAPVLAVPNGHLEELQGSGGPSRSVCAFQELATKSKCDCPAPCLTSGSEPIMRDSCHSGQASPSRQSRPRVFIYLMLW